MTPLLTDERLRTWLDSNQQQRERLCLSLLALDHRYSQVTPRRPRGGPDGARDLEALFRGRSKVWGAVGFRNSVCDSPADKRWVKKKVAEDLAAATKADPSLKHFVFFTNVDLTPKEVSSLQSCAQSYGVMICEVFYRERMRLLLDSPEGLALRYQYLGIDLSPAEQAGFFARFGDVLQGLMTERFDAIDQKLARIEFHNECQRATSYVGLHIRLRQPHRSDEVGAFQVLAVATKDTVSSPPPTLYLRVTGGPDSTDPARTPCFKSEVTVWVEPPFSALLHGHQVEAFPERGNLMFGLSVQSTAEFSRVGDFDGLWLHLYVSDGALRSVAAIDLVVNGYAIARSKLDDLLFERCRSDDEWLARCFDAVTRAKMLQAIEGPTVGSVLPPFAFTDFSGYLPVRLDDSRRLDGVDTTDREPP